MVNKQNVHNLNSPVEMTQKKSGYSTSRRKMEFQKNSGYPKLIFYERALLQNASRRLDHTRRFQTFHRCLQTSYVI